MSDHKETDIGDFGELLVDHALLAFSPNTPIANSKRKEEVRNYHVGIIRMLQGIFLGLTQPKRWTYRVYEHVWHHDYTTERLREKLQTLEKTHGGLAEYQVAIQPQLGLSKSLVLIIAKIPA